MPLGKPLLSAVIRIGRELEALGAEPPSEPLCLRIDRELYVRLIAEVGRRRPEGVRVSTAFGPIIVRPRY